MPDYIYVSYAAKDSITAKAIIEILENKGFRCWHASRDLIGWSAAGNTVAHAIADAKAIVLLFSDWANKSEFIEREVAIAVDRDLPVLVLTEDDDLELSQLLRALLSRTRWVRVRTLTRIDAALTELLLPSAAEPAHATTTPEKIDTAEILFVSNRVAEKLSTERYFTNILAHELIFGIARVHIPANHQSGVLETPWFFSGNAKKHFVLESVEFVPRAAFEARLKERSRPALLYVHGYWTTFTSAILALTQAVWDMRVTEPFTPVVFSWPSRGGFGGYLYDINSALNSRDALREVASLLHRATKSEPLHLIAHSMGNFLTLEGLSGLDPSTGVRVNEMIMAAPDVDVDLFQNLLGKVQPLAAGMTLYASASDWALRLARLLARKPRAGGVFENGPILAPHLDSIDVTSMAELFGLNHSTHSSNQSLLNDIGRLLTRREHPPAKRSAELHGVPEHPPPARYWKYAQKK